MSPIGTRQGTPTQGWEATTDPALLENLLGPPGIKRHPGNDYSKNTLLDHLAAQKPDKQMVLSPNMLDKSIPLLKKGPFLSSAAGNCRVVLVEVETRYIPHSRSEKSTYLSFPSPTAKEQRPEKIIRLIKSLASTDAINYERPPVFSFK